MFMDMLQDKYNRLPLPDLVDIIGDYFHRSFF